MRESHNEQIERWAQFVKENPGEWQRHHTKFINAIFQQHKEVMERILKEKGGKEKIRKMYRITNWKAHPSLR